MRALGNNATVALSLSILVAQIFVLNWSVTRKEVATVYPTQLPTRASDYVSAAGHSAPFSENMAVREIAGPQYVASNPNEAPDHDDLPDIFPRIHNYALLREVDMPEFRDKWWSRRPRKRNDGGMRFSHQFALWFTIRHTNPSFFVESGAHQGLTTQLGKDTISHNALLLSFDPANHTRTIEGVEYHTGIRFKDISRYDFRARFSQTDRKRGVILIDDHQSAYPRLKALCRAGLGGSYVIFDDNAQPCDGDNHSLKKLFDSSGCTGGPYVVNASRKVIQWDNFKQTRTKITLHQHRAMAREIQERILQNHTEFPPSIMPPWTPKPLYSVELLKSITKTPIFESLTELSATGVVDTSDQEFQSYGWVAITRLSQEHCR